VIFYIFWRKAPNDKPIAPLRSKGPNYSQESPAPYFQVILTAKMNTWHTIKTGQKNQVLEMIFLGNSD